MKNIEWLRKELVRREDNFVKLVENEQGVDYNSGKQVATRQAINLIDQLDEPETLSKKWIENHTASAYTIAHYSEEDVRVIMASDLKGLLIANEPEVLSQELPVIPKFVANYLCRAKADVTLMRVLEIANTRNELPKWEKEYDWISANDEKFARAWLDGYTVEEKKYYILLPKIKRNWRYVSLRGNHDEFIDHYTDSIEDLQIFTEKEIKAVEPRYFAFAVPVEELEE